MSNLGVVIVTFNAADVIRDCLETLLAAPFRCKIAVVDNASTDRTEETIVSWLNGRDGYQPGTLPFPGASVHKPVDNQTLQIIEAGENRGFAAGVNIGIAALLTDPTIDRIWLLNPDTLVPPETPKLLAEAPAGFGLMGHRILYADHPHSVQIDAGTVNCWTGVTGNLNLGRSSDCPLAQPEHADFISGASLVASRAFINAAGPMPEDYFLYYEEVDWARRAKLPIQLCANAVVYHQAGSAIGSPKPGNPPSPFSIYYKNRSRMRYLKRYHPWSWPVGWLYGMAKAGQLLCSGHPELAWQSLRGMANRPPSANITAQGRDQPVEFRP